MSNRNYSERLDALLTGLEELVLAAPDREVDAALDTDVAATRAFINSRLAKCRVAPLPPAIKRRSRPALATRRVIPRDAAGRRRLLGRLVSTRAGVPAHISMAFESREPDDAEIAEMLEELLSHGTEPGVE